MSDQVASEPTPQDIKEAPIRGAEGPTEYQGTDTLFGEKAPTDAELRGEIVENPESKEPDTSQPSGEEEKKPEVKEESVDDSKSKEEPKEEPKKDEPKEEGDKPTKPPEGYVPTAALKEERYLRKQLASELENLRAEFKAFRDISTKQDEPEFKILSEAEFDQLVSEDPHEAIKYTKKLNEYENQQKELRAAQEKEKAQREWEQSVVEKAVQRIATEVPGIYDEDAPINSEITAFANENGLSPAYLSVLTDPRTKLLIPGQKNPIILGEGASELISMIHKVYSAKGKDSRGAIEKELRTAFDTELSEKLAAKEKEVTERVTKEVMGKINEQPTYRSLGDAPGSGDTPISGNLTEAQFAKLSPEEQRKYLGG